MDEKYRTTVLRSELKPELGLSDAEVALQDAINDGTISDVIHGNEYDPEDFLVVELDSLDMAVVVPAIEAVILGSSVMDDTLREGIARRLAGKLSRTIREQKFIIVEDDDA